MRQSATALFVVCALSWVARAQDPPSASPDQDAVRRLVEQYMTEAEEKKKAEDDKKKEEGGAKGDEQEQNPSMTGTWDNGLFFQSPDKDWRIHVGGRIQFNSVWWQQPEFLKGPPPGNAGVPGQGPGGGIGALDDGTYFRRVRFRSDGTGYGVVEYALELNFEQLNQVTFDHIWIGLKDLPYLGTVRVGHHKVPQGLEMIGSDYHLTLLERSSLSDAIWTLFAPGVFVMNNYFDQRLTVQSMVHRIQPLGVFNAAAFGDGDYAATGRTVWTPVYEGEGRCVVHVGGSYQWRTGNLGRTIGGTGSDFADTQGVVRFRARPELRDAVGVGQVAGIGGNAARFVDTGFLLGERVHTVSPEVMATWGPLNVRAEAAWAFVENVKRVFGPAAIGMPSGDPTFWGGYVQASYFLTGEHWGYDRRLGMYDRPKVRENFIRRRDDDGRFHCASGAWEVAYRYSYLDLNDDGIDGGQMNQHTIGLNWYLNDNTKVQFNYLNAQRNVAAPAVSGTVHGFGILTQRYF